MKIRPLQDRVVVKRQDEETTSAGGIVLPGSATEKPQQGEVVAVGPGKKSEDGKNTPVDLKVGDHVVFGSSFDQELSQTPAGLLILDCR